MHPRAAVRLLALLGALVILGGGVGCGRKPAPQSRPDLPTTLPSEQEAQRVRESSREAIPLLPEGERGLGEDDLPPVVDSLEVAPLPTSPPPNEAPTRYGYRVQIFASSIEALAEERAAEAEQLFDEKVYVEFEGLLFKVRVGDCVSRDEADALRRQAVALGHDGAFVVDTQVTMR